MPHSQFPLMGVSAFLTELRSPVPRRSWMLPCPRRLPLRVAMLPTAAVSPPSARGRRRRLPRPTLPRTSVSSGSTSPPPTWHSSTRSSRRRCHQRSGESSRDAIIVVPSLASCTPLEWACRCVAPTRPSPLASGFVSDPLQLNGPLCDCTCTGVYSRNGGPKTVNMCRHV